MVGNSSAFEVHCNEYTITKSNQAANISITVNLRVFAMSFPAIVDMLINEVSLVFVETISDKHGDIILPFIARCGREQNPFIDFGNLEKCFGPCSVPDNSLLVKYKESIFDCCILANVVP